MKYETLYDEISRLDISEKILLAEEIWDSIAAEQERVEMTEAQKVELDHRIEAYNKSPSEGSSWEEVKNRVKPSK